MRLLRRVCGYEVENIPNISFRMMSIVLSIRETFFNISKRIDNFGIDNGSVVVDFGCGPGNYVVRASKAVGPSGKVYAVDIHPLAIESIKKK